MMDPRAQKVVKMRKKGQLGMPDEVIDPRRTVARPRRRRSSQPRHMKHYHRHEHFFRSSEPALTPQDFWYVARGIEALESAKSHRHGRRMSDLKLWAVVVVGAVLVFGGLHQLFR